MVYDPDGQVIRQELGAATPAAVALITATAVTVASWSADDYQTRAGELQIVKSDGSSICRHVFIRHNGTSAADATTATIESHGAGSHDDIAATAIDADVSGAGTSQVVRLRITAAANGASWSATFYPSFLKTATP